MKKFLSGLLTGIILAATLPALAQQSSIKLIVNGKEVPCYPPPQMINNRVFVPIRFVAEAIGANVNWDGERNAVVITSSQSSLGPIQSSQSADARSKTSDSQLIRAKLNEKVALGNVEVVVKEIAYYDSPITVKGIIFEKQPGMRLASVTLEITTLKLPELPHSGTYSPFDVINRWVLKDGKYRGRENMSLPGGDHNLLPGTTVTKTIYFYI